MLHGFEVLDGVADLLRRTAGKHADANGGEDIFEIVRALERDFGTSMIIGRSPAIAKEDLAVADEGSVLTSFLRLNQIDLRARAAASATVVGSSALSTAKSLGALVFEDARLGADIVRQGVVAVEMIGRDVEDQRRCADGSLTMVSSWKLETSRTIQVFGEPDRQS